MDTNEELRQKHKLNRKQQAFADYYIESGNITQSALKAGYSENYAKSNAYTMLEHDGIKGYIQEVMQSHTAKGIADPDEILITLTNILKGTELGSSLIGIGPGKQAITEVPPTVSEKIKAGEMLGKRFLMWTDKQIVEELKPTIIDNVPTDD